MTDQVWQCPRCGGHGLAPEGAPSTDALEATEALEEVNAVRSRKGLNPFAFDADLTTAAQAAADYRAQRRMAGHTANDFSFLPAGARASASGCAAWLPSWGWGACCTYDDYACAGAAWAPGSDGRRYMHLFVR